MILWLLAVFRAHPVPLIFLPVVLLGMRLGRAGRIFSASVSAIWLVAYAPFMTFILLTVGGKTFSDPVSIGLLAELLIITMVALAAFFRAFGLQYAGTGNPVTSFWDCLYFAIITWTTVGYGDIVPSGRWARLGAAYAAILGYFTMAAMVAAVSAAMLRS